MVNTRAKIQRIQNSRKTCFLQASIEDPDLQSTWSGALISSNDDLLTEILQRLPVTSILRFKSVSKHWLWLLSHRSFTLRYDNLKKSPGLFFRNIYIPFDVENLSPPPFHSLDFCFDPYGIKIVQSCNGLLLCCSDQRNQSVCKYYVFNPTTKQFAKIPSVPGGQIVRKTICFMGLAYHQTGCVHYKVVCIRNAEPNGELPQILIYSSDTGKWKISSESFSDNIYIWLHSDSAVYWNGAIHWDPSSRNPMYFKVQDEQVEKLPLPVQVESSGGKYYRKKPMYFGESRGHLHLVESADGGNRLHLNVYEMLNDHSGWFVKFQVELDELPSAFPEMKSSSWPEFDVLDVVRGEKDEDTFMVVRIIGKLIRYNVHDKSFKQIFKLNNYYWLDKVHRYTETLTYF